MQNFNSKIFPALLENGNDPNEPDIQPPVPPDVPNPNQPINDPVETPPKEFPTLDSPPKEML